VEASSDSDSDMEEDVEAAVEAIEAIEEAEPLRGQNSSGPEVRIYMQPPVERADADTDIDSGKILKNAVNSLHFSVFQIRIR